MCAKSLQSSVTLCDLMDCSPPRSSVHGILQARILEWVAMPSSRGCSRPRDRTCVSSVSCIDRWVLDHQHHLGSPELKYMNPSISDWSAHCYSDSQQRQSWQMVSTSLPPLYLVEERYCECLKSFLVLSKPQINEYMKVQSRTEILFMTSNNLPKVFHLN